MTDPALAAFLLDPRAQPLLEVFLARECTVSDAARMTEASLNTTFARVRRLLALGFLVEGTGTVRVGRRVRTYRSSASCYFVPYEVTPFETLEAQHEATDLAHARLLAQGVVRARRRAFPSYGSEVSRLEDGALEFRPAFGPGQPLSAVHPDAPAVLNLWDEALHLSAADAKALQLELRELYHRYRHRGGPQTYHLRLGLAERP